MAGLGLAWFRETWNQKFHTEAEIEEILGIPVIAVIPNLKEDKAA
jgi:capsular polysaccharide biosynthesis protein